MKQSTVLKVICAALFVVLMVWARSPFSHSEVATVAVVEAFTAAVVVSWRRRWVSGGGGSFRGAGFYGGGHYHSAGYYGWHGATVAGEAGTGAIQVRLRMGIQYRLAGTILGRIRIPYAYAAAPYYYPYYYPYYVPAAPALCNTRSEQQR